MIKYSIYLAILLTLVSVAQPARGVSAPASIQTFWASFKSAVAQKNKDAVAELSHFPLDMPYGMKSVKTKAEFARRYGEIFNGEADAVTCFSKAKLEKTDSQNYFVACGFKKSPADSEDKPIEYLFQNTKTGWRFVGLDNINE